MHEKYKIKKKKKNPKPIHTVLDTVLPALASSSGNGEDFLILTPGVTYENSSSETELFPLVCYN